jgi:hypothetical protein
LVGHIITVQVTAVQIIAALVITKHLGFPPQMPADETAAEQDGSCAALR